MAVDTPRPHTTVLLNEAVDALFSHGTQAFAGAADGTYVDATFGRGGHSQLMLSRLSDAGRLIAFDRDPEAVAQARTIQDPRFSIRHEGFSHLGELPPASVAGLPSGCPFLAGTDRAQPYPARAHQSPASR